MNNYAYFVVLFIMLGIVCYQVPQAIDKSYSNADNLVNNHKALINY